MPSVAVADVQLYYQQSGSGDAVVLVHGTGGNADAWSAVQHHLGDRLRTVAYDRRGYQRSAAGRFPPQASFHRRHGEDLIGLIERLQLAPAVVVGWSAGSFAALHAALLKPGAIRGVVLFEPPLHASRHLTWQTFRTFAAVGWRRLRGHGKRAAEPFLRMVAAYSDGRSSLDTMPLALRNSFQRDVPALLAELQAGTGEELGAAQLAKLRVPVALMQGELSPPLFTRAMERTRKIFPQAPLVQVPRANHFALIDDPATFAQSLRLAVAAVTGRAP
jgi:pimeloyl-ACP methyl ester carboxylesterase